MKASAYAYSFAFSLIGVGAIWHEQNFLAGFVSLLAAVLCLDLAEKGATP